MLDIWGRPVSSDARPQEMLRWPGDEARQARLQEQNHMGMSLPGRGL